MRKRKTPHPAIEPSAVSATVRLSDLTTVPRAAELLNTTRQAIIQAFNKGRIAGYKVDRVILLNTRSVLEYNETRHPGGRPKNISD